MITGYFDKEKALEVLLYVSSRVQKMYHTQKIIYFANRLHLDKYGRFVIDDRIIAMKNGPVLSAVYDMIKSAKGTNSYFPEVSKSISYIHGGSSLDQLSPKREADTDYLSQSDIICLNECIEKYKNMSFTELEQISHDELYFTANLNDEISIDEVINHSSQPEILRDYLKG